jgi:hypothetical protein
MTVKYPYFPQNDEDDIKPPSDISNPIIGKCPACGLEVHRIMGYCCPRSGCPVGLGGTQGTL